MSSVLELQRLVVRLVADASRWNAGFDMAEDRIDRISRKATHLGRHLTLKVTAPLALMGTASLKAYSDFDDAMTKSTAIMTDMTDDMRAKMEEQAKLLSGQGVQSATQLGEAYYFLASAGLNAEQSIAALPVTQQFATAGAFDMARATDLLTDAQSALGMTVSDTAQNMQNMERMSDVLVKANTLANASVEQFSIALTSKAGSALKTFNKDAEEGVAVLAAMADQGIKAELAGNQLDRFIRLLAKSSMDAAENHKALGLSVFDASGKMRNMADIVGQLEDILRGMSDEQKVATLDMLGFEARTQQAVLPLIGLSDKIADYESKLRSAGGTTKNVADNQMQSFASQMKVLKNQMTVVAIEIGEVLAPSVLRLNKVIEKGLIWWRSLNDQQKQLLVTLAKIIAMAGPFLIVFGKVAPLAITATKHMNMLMRTTLVAMNAMRVAAFAALLPFIKIIAIAGLVVGAIAGIIYILTGGDGLKAAWNAVHTTVSNFFKNAIGFLYNFQHNMGIMITWVRTNWQSLILDMLRFFGHFTVVMAQNALVGVRLLFRLWAAFTGWWQGRLIAAVKYIFSYEFVKTIVDFTLKALETLKAWGMKLMDVFKGIVSAVTTLLLEIPKAFFNVLVTIGSKVGSVLWDLLSGNIPNPAEIIAEIAGDVAAEVGKALGKAKDAFQKHAGPIIDDMAEFGNQLVDDYSAGMQNANFAETAQKIFNEERGKFQNPLADFTWNTEGPEGLKFDRATAAVETAAETANQAFQGVADTYTAAGATAVEQVEMVNDAVETVGDTTKKVHDQISGVSAFDAVEAGSREAMQRLYEYRSMLRGVAVAQSLATGAGSLGGVATPKATTLASQNSDLTVTQRSAPQTRSQHQLTIEKLLGEIASNTEKGKGDTLQLDFADISSRTG